MYPQLLPQCWFTDDADIGYFDALLNPIFQMDRLQYIYVNVNMLLLYSVSIDDRIF